MTTNPVLTSVPLTFRRPEPEIKASTPPEAEDAEMMLWPKEEAEAVTAQPSTGRRGRPGQRPVTLGPFREVKGEPQTLGPLRSFRTLAQHRLSRTRESRVTSERSVGEVCFVSESH